MENMDKPDSFILLCEYLKNLADSTHAGKAYIDFTHVNGDVFRVEYKRAKPKK